jgi:hypothetical protein
MKGDFSRDTFDPKNHFLRVLMQQGRVQLDADWNEQASILLHYIQTLAADLIGPYGGPVGGFDIIALDPKDNNFGNNVKNLVDKEFEDNSASDKEKRDDETARLQKIFNTNGDFIIGPGRYYVDGILCENEVYLGYKEQDDYPISDSKEDSVDPNAEKLIVYLDVWERHMAWYEQPYSFVPGMREVALRGPDTATRSKVVWQVRVIDNTEYSLPDNFDQKYLETNLITFCDNFIDFLKKDRKDRGLLKAMAKKSGKPDNNPCTIPPKALYRGAENQLYRVEIHMPGNALYDAQDSGSVGATFKWSRDNGSVVFPMEKDPIELLNDQMIVTLAHLGLDDRSSMNIGDWVELVHDGYTLRNHAYPLLKVDSIDQSSMEVILKWKTDKPKLMLAGLKQPFIRRWDQTDKGGKYKILDSGDIPIYEGSDDKSGWIELEDGVQIQFFNANSEKDSINDRNYYHTGDYWLIPARTERGNVEWPCDENGNIKGMAPHGIEHHYAPLAVLWVKPSVQVKSCCRWFAKDP